MKLKELAVGVCRVVVSRTAVRIVIAGASLGCIAYGLSLYYKPLAFVVPGMLLWIESIRGQ